MAADDGVEQQLIQQLDALIDEPADDELAAARDGAHSWTSCSEIAAVAPEVAARSCSTRRPGSRLPKARRHSRRRRASNLCGGPRASPRIAPRRRRHNPVQRESEGSAGGRAGGAPAPRASSASFTTRGTCRRRRRVSVQRVAKGRAGRGSCSDSGLAARRGLAARCAAGWRRRDSVQRESENCPRMGFLFSLRHRAPRRASRR